MSPRASAIATTLAGWLAGCAGPPPIGGTTTESTSETTHKTTGNPTSSTSSDADATSGSSSTGSTSFGESAGETPSSATSSGEEGSTSATAEAEGTHTGGAASTQASDADASSSGDPTLPESPTLWLAADFGIELEGDTVVSLRDRSGMGNDALQSDPAAMPRLVRAADGATMIEFDGQDDALRLPSGFDAFEGASFFTVAEALPHSGCAGILSLSNGDDDDDIEFGRHRQNLLYYEVLGEYVEGATDAFEAGRRFLASIVQDGGGTARLRLNGTLTGSGTLMLPHTVTRTQNYVGKDTYDECPTSFHGRIGELLLYSRALDPEEQSRVESYLAQRWNIAI